MPTSIIVDGEHVVPVRREIGQTWRQMLQRGINDVMLHDHVHLSDMDEIIWSGKTFRMGDFVPREFGASPHEVSATTEHDRVRRATAAEAHTATLVSSGVHAG